MKYSIAARFFIMFKPFMLKSLLTSTFTFSFAEELPYNNYFEYFGPEYKLDVPSNNMANHNTPEYLQKMTQVSPLTSLNA